MGKWNEVLDDIGTTKPWDEESEEKPEDNPEAPEVEESPDPDKVTEDPEEDEDETPEQDEDDEPADTEEESEESDDEEQPETEAESEDDDPDDPWIMVQGQRVRQSDVLKWRDQGLMRDDYTRKTQQLSEQQKRLQDSAREIQTLATDIAKDPTLQRFLAANPDAIQYLMADPKATRQLIGNPEGTKQFWREYNVLKENPGIAERLYERETQDKPPELTEATKMQAAVSVAESLNYVIEEVGKEFPEVDGTDVADHLLGLVGLTEQALPKDPNMARESVVQAMGRLYNMLFFQHEGQTMVNPTLIRDRFSTLQQLGKAKKTRDETKAEEHNRKVDKALAEQGSKRPPASPKSGTPVTTKARPQEYDSFRAALDDIMSG